MPDSAVSASVHLPEDATSRSRGSVHPDRWLAVLRIAVGLWFLKSVVTKLDVALLGGVLPVPAAAERWIGFMPGRVAEFAAGNPIPWYRGFLMEVVVPNGVLFAHLTAYGEVVVGIGLTLGLLTRWASAAGFLLATNYFLSTFWMSPGQMGFHLLLMVTMVAFAGSAAGRVCGLDGWLSGNPGAPRITGWAGLLRPRPGG